MRLFKRAIPPPPQRLPDADEKYRLARVPLIQGKDGYLVAPPDTWQLQEYREPYWWAWDREWCGNNWRRVCDISGSQKAIEALRILKSKDQILYVSDGEIRAGHI